MKKCIIFDLGRVLIIENYLSFFKKLSKFDLMIYSLYERKNIANMKTELFEIMEKNFGKGKYSMYPRIFEKWLMNDLSSIKIKEILLKTVKNENVSFYHTNLLVNFVNIIFTPENFADVMVPYTGKEFLDMIPQDIPLYLITNYNFESFNQVYKKYPLIFSRFRDIIVSGKVNMMKPNTDIYTYALKKWNLDPKDCLYIDDEFDNILKAQKLEMKTIYFTDFEKNKIELLDFLK